MFYFAKDPLLLTQILLIIIKFAVYFVYNISIKIHAKHKFNGEHKR